MLVLNRLLLLLFSFSLCFGPVFSQNNAGCPNANFSMANFTNWVGYTGTYQNPAATMGIVNGRHTIISAQGTDPFSCGGL
ncbi:MAG: hypothetical protein ACO28O_01720, partial [Crocinitomicaceae bacterium]